MLLLSSPASVPDPIHYQSCRVCYLLNLAVTCHNFEIDSEWKDGFICCLMMLLALIGWIVVVHFVFIVVVYNLQFIEIKVDR